MTTPELVRRFEDGTLAPATFTHRDHLRVAWHYLETMELEAALARFVERLRALLRVLGADAKFHRTLTWAWVLLLHEARAAHPGLDFDAVLAREPRLLDAKSAWARLPGLSDARARDEVRLLP